MRETTTDVRKTITILCRRVDYLDRLMVESHDKHDLAATLDLSKSTVYKRLRELEEAGLIERMDGQWRPTLFGRVLYRRYRSLEDVCEFRAVLSVLPGCIDIDFAMLDGGEAIQSEKHAPYNPIRNMTKKAAEERGRNRLLSPVFLPGYVDLFSVDTECVFEDTVVDHLRAHYPDMFDTLLRDDGFSMWQVSEPVPFGLFLFNDRDVCIVVHDSRGNIVGAIENDTDGAAEWAQEWFIRYRDQGRELNPSLLQEGGR